MSHENLIAKIGISESLCDMCFMIILDVVGSCWFALFFVRNSMCMSILIAVPWKKHGRFSILTKNADAFVVAHLTSGFSEILPRVKVNYYRWIFVCWRWFLLSTTHGRFFKHFDTFCANLSEWGHPLNFHWNPPENSHVTWAMKKILVV